MKKLPTKKIKVDNKTKERKILNIGERINKEIKEGTERVGNCELFNSVKKEKKYEQDLNNIKLGHITRRVLKKNVERNQVIHKTKIRMLFTIIYRIINYASCANVGQRRQQSLRAKNTKMTFSKQPR